MIVDWCERMECVYLSGNHEVIGFKALVFASVVGNKFNYLSRPGIGLRFFWFYLSLEWIYLSLERILMMFWL